MANIEYTPYVQQQFSFQQPVQQEEIAIPIIRRKQKPKEEIQLAPLPELMPISEVKPIVKGVISNPNNVNVGNMQGALDALANAGISFRVTSGIRPGALTAQGRESHHAKGNAVDIVIDDYDDAKRKVKASKELQDIFNKNKGGILEETTPEMLAKTKGSGSHGHIGFDNSAIENFKRIIAKKGAKLLQPGGQVAYSPHMQSDHNFNITLVPYVPGQYVRQYDLSDKPRIKSEGYMGPPQEEVPIERTITDLAKFTGGFETFRPDAYIQDTSDGKPQLLAGYGSSKQKIIELAQQGLLTEEIARKEMERHLQSEYDEGMSKVPNFKNLPRGVQLALVDTSYNGKGVVNTIKTSPKLMGMINSGITDPKELVKEMTHSKSANGWLGVRSAARRAMALGEYDGDNANVDKYGRQVDYNQYKGPQDGKSSPYYNKY